MSRAGTINFGKGHGDNFIYLCFGCSEKAVRYYFECWCRALPGTSEYVLDGCSTAFTTIPRNCNWFKEDVRYWKQVQGLFQWEELGAGNLLKSSLVTGAWTEWESSRLWLQRSCFLWIWINIGGSWRSAWGSSADGMHSAMQYCELFFSRCVCAWRSANDKARHITEKMVRGRKRKNWVWGGGWPGTNWRYWKSSESDTRKVWL